MKVPASTLRHFVFRHVKVSKCFNHTHCSFSSNSVGVWGTCFDQVQPHAGLKSAPELMRDRGLISRMEELGWNVKDYGDIAMERKEGLVSSEDVLEFSRRAAARVEEVLKEDIAMERKEGRMSSEDVLEFSRRAAARVEEVLREGRICLTIEGGPLSRIGTLAGHLAVDPQAVVLWVDAHPDINTMKSSTSGNMHGMPVSFNIKQLESENVSSLPSSSTSWLVPRLLANRIAYIGLRDVDGPEWKMMEDLGIKYFAMSQIHKVGVREALRQALEAVDPNNDRNIHLSFDIDVLDSVEAPSCTGSKVPGGLTMREAITLVEEVAAEGRIKAVDLVEVNPSLGSERDVEVTVDAALEIVMAAMGRRRDGRARVGHEIIEKQ